MIMKRLLLVFSLMLLSVSVYSQSLPLRDSVITAKENHLYQNGNVLNEAQVKNLFMKAYGDGAIYYEEYLDQQKKYRRGSVFSLSGLALAGAGVVYHVFVFQKKAPKENNRVDPGPSILFIGGGIAMTVIGIIQIGSSTRSVRSMADGLNKQLNKPIVTPGITPNGMGVIISF